MTDNVALFETISKWSQILGAVVFLLVLIWLFRKYLTPAIAANEVARNAELSRAEERRDHLKREIAEANALVATATREAASIKERAAIDASREVERIAAEAKAEGQRVVANAERELDRGRIAAKDQLRIEFIEKALGRARVLAGERLDPAANERLVDDTVTTLMHGAHS